MLSGFPDEVRKAQVSGMRLKRSGIAARQTRRLNFLQERADEVFGSKSPPIAMIIPCQNLHHDRILTLRMGIGADVRFQSIEMLTRSFSWNLLASDAPSRDPLGLEAWIIVSAGLCFT